MEQINDFFIGRYVYSVDNKYRLQLSAEIIEALKKITCKSKDWVIYQLIDKNRIVCYPSPLYHKQARKHLNMPIDNPERMNFFEHSYKSPADAQNRILVHPKFREKINRKKGRLEVLVRGTGDVFLIEANENGK
jgi:DNA-binding transcriptional regulator/RsmH inhibitor MraZ